MKVFFGKYFDIMFLGRLNCLKKSINEASLALFNVGFKLWFGPCIGPKVWPQKVKVAKIQQTEQIYSLLYTFVTFWLTVGFSGWLSTGVDTSACFLTHFVPLSSSYTLWKHQKTSVFLMFPGVYRKGPVA